MVDEVKQEEIFNTLINQVKEYTNSRSKLVLKTLLPKMGIDPTMVDDLPDDHCECLLYNIRTDYDTIEQFSCLSDIRYFNDDTKDLYSRHGVSLEEFEKIFDEAKAQELKLKKDLINEYLGASIPPETKAIIQNLSLSECDRIINHAAKVRTHLEYMKNK